MRTVSEGRTVGWFQDKLRFKNIRDIPLSFSVDHLEGHLHIEIFLEIEGTREKLPDPTSLRSYGQTFQREGVSYTIDLESLETLSAILTQKPDISKKGTLIMQLRPSVLKFLRTRKGVQETNSCRELDIKEKSLKKALHIDYDKNTGLVLNGGYKNEWSGKFVPGRELDHTHDRRYARFGNTFIPLPPPCESEGPKVSVGSESSYPSDGQPPDSWECVDDKIIPLHGIPEFFTRDLVLVKMDHEAVLTQQAKAIEIHDDGFRPYVHVRSAEPGWLEFDVRFGNDTYQLPSADIRETKTENDYVQVNDSAWMKIEEEVIRSTESYLSDLETVATEAGYRIAVTRFATLEEFIQDIGGIREVTRAYQDFLDTITSFKADPTFRLPEQMESHLTANGIDLRPYQREGIQWLIWLVDHHLHGLLADDMGLGKTIQTAVVMAYDHMKNEAMKKEERENGEKREHGIRGENGEWKENWENGERRKNWEKREHGIRQENGEWRGNRENGERTENWQEREKKEIKEHSLIIVPRSVVRHWTREIHRCFPSINTYEYIGEDRSVQDFLESNPTIVISTYTTIRIDIETISSIPFNFLILDEATRIKNPSAKRTRAIKRINASHRICLSGTPIENRPLELWSIFDFMIKGHLGTHSEFIRQFEDPIEEGDQEALSRLAQRIRPFILRRLKDDVEQDLPDKIEINEYCGMTDEQRSLYLQIQETQVLPIRRKIEAGGEVSFSVNILLILTKLKQVCDHPSLINGELEPLMGRSRKFDRIIRKIVEISRGKEQVVVFSHFLDMLDLFERALEERSISYMRVDGSTKDRQRYFDEFNEGNYSVALLSIQACGHGVNLTGANHVIHADRWWNPAVEDQATDRVHRIGQEKSVFVHRITAVGTIEEKIANLLERKRGLSDSVIGEASAGKMEWTRDELIELLKPLEVAKSDGEKQEGVQEGVWKSRQ